MNTLLVVALTATLLLSLLAATHAAALRPSFVLPGGFEAPSLSRLVRPFVDLYTAVKTTGGGSLYADPALGFLDVGLNVRIDPSAFKGTDFVDADGYLKPGTPILANLAPVSAADQTAKYVVMHATKIAEGNTNALLDAAADQDIALHTEGKLDRTAIEHNLGRALSANEVAAFTANPRFVLVAY